MEDRAGIDVAAARAHHQTFERREAHRGVDGLAVIDGAYRAAVAEVTGDELVGRGGGRVHLPELPGDIAMRDAVEAVAPDLLLGQVFVGQRVGVSVRRQRVVERRIEHRDLRNVRKVLAGGADAFEVARIVQRREGGEFLDSFLHFGVD